MKNYKKLKAIPVMLGALMTFSSVTAAAGCSGDNNSGSGSGGGSGTGGSGDGSCKITYYLNYPGAERTKREVSVEPGSKAIEWNLTRDGYALTGWYTDATCRTPYNFSNKVNGDVNLYAGWWVQDECTVTFHMNYGADRTSVLLTKEREKIDEKLAPKVTRMSRDFVGWYKDAQCTQEWNFETDLVEGDMELYAGYSASANLSLGSDGKPVYNNEPVNVWIWTDFGLYDGGLTSIAEQFNADNEGRIKVTLSKTLSNQNTFSLRFQQTPEKTRCETTYYSAEDIYDLAGIVPDDSAWYAGMARDSYVEGTLTSIPIVAGVPYIIYNKSLMTQYNGSNPLPNNYSSFSALVKRVAIAKDIKGLVAPTNEWSWQEGPSYTAYAQNGADIYYYDESTGSFQNDWSDSAVYAKAQTATQITYDLLGVGGEYKGGAMSSSSIIDSVKNGSAFAGMVCFPITSQADSIISNSSSIGIMPLSGLFTNSTGAHSQDIPVHTVGFAFYKAKNCSLTNLAAAAEFADYVSKHSYSLAEAGWYPMAKSVVESDQFKNSENARVQLLKQVGNPENFRTLDGFINGKAIINTGLAQSIMTPNLALQTVNISAMTESIHKYVKGQLY